MASTAKVTQALPAGWSELSPSEQTLLWKIRDHETDYGGSVAMRTFDLQRFQTKAIEHGEPAFGYGYASPHMFEGFSTPGRAWARVLHEAVDMDQLYRSLRENSRKEAATIKAICRSQLMLARFAVESVDLQEAVPLVQDLDVVARLSGGSMTAHAEISLITSPGGVAVA
jgi:hypothetical protein